MCKLFFDADKDRIRKFQLSRQVGDRVGLTYLMIAKIKCRVNDIKYMWHISHYVTLVAHYVHA